MLLLDVGLNFKREAKFIENRDRVHNGAMAPLLTFRQKLKILRITNIYNRYLSSTI